MTSRLTQLRNVSSRVGLIAFSLTTTLYCAAQPVELPKDVETNSFSMTVKVVDAVSGKPLENATVMLPMLGHSSPPRPTKEWHFPTDARGVATVQVPGALVSSYFSLAVSNTGYPMKSADWNAQSGSVRGALPTEYTFRLEHGGVIGGFVRDEQGKPMPGVKVLPWGNGSAAYRQNSAAANVREYSAVPRDEQAALVTDAAGRWLFTNLPPDVTALSIDLLRPGGGRDIFATSEMGRQYYGGNSEEISLEELRRTNAVIVLKDGVTIRGVVVDGGGKPVRNAAVRERSGNNWNTMPYQITNDAQGRFEFPHRTGLQYLITAEAEGYSLGSAIATASTDMPELKLVLPAARPLRLKVVGTNDEPVAGAGVGFPEYRNLGHLMTWRGTTDLGGLVVWSSAPTQALSVHIATTNYAARMARLKSTSDEQVIRLRKEPAKTAAVRLRVLDEQTGQLIARFPVWKELQQHLGFKDTGLVGTNGELKTELSTSDFPEGYGMTFRFQVRAEGYAPATTEQTYFDEGDFEATLLLRKSRPPAGVVLLPDGKAAADAKVMIASQNASVYMNTADRPYLQPGVQSVQSGADGSFKFEAAEDDQRVVVIHRAGFATMTVGELRASGKIPLQPYGKVEGTVSVAGKPVARMYLNFRSPIVYGANGGYQVHYSATTDAAGRFVFTNLPAGDYLLYRMPLIINGTANTESHRLLVSVAAGETKQIDYGFGGRQVIGRIETDGEVDWKNDSHAISLKLPPGPASPNYYAYATPKEFEKARQNHGKSKAVLDYERKRQLFQLVFDRDGNFRIDDVPPGTYELSIRATKPNKDPNAQRWQRTEEVIGSLKRDIVIPAGAAGEEFDLGSLEMEVKEGLSAPSTPLDFAAEQLDGKPFKLVSLRGRPTVLVFWGMWAPGSLAKLENIQAAVAKLETNGRPALVTVNLDSSNEAAREGVKGLGAGWIHTRLSGEAMFEATERLSVDTLPLVLLLDAQGRVRGRDVDGKRLASSVKRMAAGKN